METMDEYKEAVDELVLGRNGLVVHSIHFVTVDVLKLGEKEKLQSVSLGHHEHVAFKVSNYYPNKSKLNKNDNDDNIRGCTLCIKTPEGIKQVVFIRESQHRPEFFKGGMDGYENQKLFDYMMQLSTLAHELGHVKDMQKNQGGNFSFSPTPTANLPRAEGYANAYCLNYLKSKKADLALRINAQAIYRLHDSKVKFEKEMYFEICKRVGKGRLKKWAR